MVCASLFNAPTYIGRNAYVGQGVAVAHECAIGEGAQIQTGAILFGTTEVEDGAYVAPGALLCNGVTVGERARVSPGSLVTRDVEPEARVTGYFAVEHGRFIAALRRRYRPRADDPANAA